MQRWPIGGNVTACLGARRECLDSPFSRGNEMERPVKKPSKDWSKDPQKFTNLADRLKKVSVAEVYDVLDRLFGSPKQCLDLGDHRARRVGTLRGREFGGMVPNFPRWAERA